jgi:hypothetical protein
VKKMNTDKIGAIAAGIGMGMVGVYFITGVNMFSDIKSSLKQSAETKKDCGCGNSAKSESFETPNLPSGIRGRQQMASEYSLDRINPVAVEGAEDVYGAEEGHSFSPKPSLKMW